MSDNLFDIVDFEKVLRINENNLEGEMSTCAFYYFQYAMMAADAEQLEENCKLEKQAYEADKAVILKAADAKGIMKEADLDRACYQDPKWQVLYNKEIEYRMYVKKLKAMVAAFDIKSRMLMSMNRRSIFKDTNGRDGIPYRNEE